MNKILTIMVLGIFLIGIGSAMSNDYPSTKNSIGKNDMKRPTENSITSTKTKRSSGGGSFVTLWVKKTSTSDCEKADVITINGVVIPGRHGVPLNEFMRKEVERPIVCHTTDKPLPIGWWNPTFMMVWNKLYGGLIE